MTEAAGLESLYNGKVLEFAGNIPHIGRLASPDATATEHSRLCGSTIIVDLLVTEGVVTDFAQEVRACAIGQAAASILARDIVGATSAELRDVRAAMRAMLTQGGPPPSGRFSELKFLEPVRDYPARHPATMLAFDAVVAALNEIEKRKTPADGAS